MEHNPPETDIKLEPVEDFTIGEIIEINVGNTPPEVKKGLVDNMSGLKNSEILSGLKPFENYPLENEPNVSDQINEMIEIKMEDTPPETGVNTEDCTINDKVLWTICPA